MIGTGAVYSVNQKVRSQAWTVPQNSHETTPQTAAQKKPYTGSRQEALPSRAMGRAIVPQAQGTIKEKLTEKPIMSSQGTGFCPAATALHMKSEELRSHL